MLGTRVRRGLLQNSQCCINRILLQYRFEYHTVHLQDCSACTCYRNLLSRELERSCPTKDRTKRKRVQSAERQREVYTYRAALIASLRGGSGQVTCTACGVTLKALIGALLRGIEGASSSCWIAYIALTCANLRRIWDALRRSWDAYLAGGADWALGAHKLTNAHIARTVAEVASETREWSALWCWRRRGVWRRRRV